MSAVARLAWLDTVRLVVSWRSAVFVVALFLVFAVWLEPNPTYFTPDDVERVAPAALADALLDVWSSSLGFLTFFLFPAVLLTSSLVGDDRAAGGPMLTVPRVGGPGRWWLAKLLTVVWLALAYVVTFYVVTIAAAAVAGFDLSLEPSAYAAVESNQRSMVLMPGKTALETALLSAPAAWVQLIPVLLIGAVAGVISPNRIVAYAIPVAYVVLSYFVGRNSVVVRWISPAEQFFYGNHDPMVVANSVPWLGSFAVTALWICGLTAAGWVASRRVEL